MRKHHDRIAQRPLSGLTPVSYEKLRLQVLRRDSWRCQYCGATSNLEVHHQQFRSHCGSDSEENLITPCSVCHAATHSGRQRPSNRERRRATASHTNNKCHTLRV